MSKPIKICHLTSAHPRFDIRIYRKECISLQKDFDVHLIVADDKGDQEIEGLHIFDVGKETGRLNRFLKTPKKILKKALSVDAAVYHLHDPDLLLIANKLKKKDKIVIFDAHEDIPKQLLSKPYLSKWKSRIASKLFGKYEKRVTAKLDIIITATPVIRDKFLQFHKNVIDINNYPLMNELYAEKSDWSHKKEQVAYVGGISKIRGILEVISSLSHLKSEHKILQLVGEFSEKETYESALKTEGFEKVNQLGFLSREEVKTILDESMAGVVTFLPVPNHIDAQPNKMFEYMSAGIPVIGSKFPLWQEIIEGNSCGICVNPNEPREIAEAFQYIFDHPEKAAEMGENGVSAIRTRYNWEAEEIKLISKYKEVLHIND